MSFSGIKLTGLGTAIQNTSLVTMGYLWVIIQNKTQGDFISLIDYKLENDIWL